MHILRSLLLYFVFFLMLAGCTLGPETAVSPTRLPVTATTISATATTPPTATAVPPTPTLMPVPTATPTAVASPTPSVDESSSSWLSAINTVTIYSGPGSEFAPAGTLEAGATVKVLGDSQQDWIPIECQDGADSCWVLWDYNSLYPYEGQPLTLSIPDPAGLQSDTSTTVSPDAHWQAQVTRSETVSLTGDWVPFFYVELKVTSLDGGATWMPVSEWHAGGLGEEDAPRLFHWSQDGRHLYYTSLAYPDGACAFYDNIGDYLDRLDLSDGSVAALPPPLARGIMALSPDETWMAYRSGQSLVVRELATAYDASQDSLKWQLPLDVTWPTQVSEVVWSPDSQRLFVTADHRLEGNCEIAGHSSWELDVATGILTATSIFVPPAEPTAVP